MTRLTQSSKWDPTWGEVLIRMRGLWLTDAPVELQFYREQVLVVTKGEVRYLINTAGFKGFN